MRIAEFDTFPYMKCMERKGSRKKKKKVPIKMLDEQEMLLIISWMIVPKVSNSSLNNTNAGNIAFTLFRMH